MPGSNLETHFCFSEDILSDETTDSDEQAELRLHPAEPHWECLPTGGACMGEGEERGCLSIVPIASKPPDPGEQPPESPIIFPVCRMNPSLERRRRGAPV